SRQACKVKRVAKTTAGCRPGAFTPCRPAKNGFGLIASPIRLQLQDSVLKYRVDMNRSIIDEERSAAMRLNVEELQRYSRHLIMPEVTSEGQSRLKAARVLCIGAGGLGSPAALYLAAAGVGTIGIVDFDDVNLSNLQRQILHGTKDIGRGKLESARDR